jgi:uncharacterized membrane protein
MLHAIKIYFTLIPLFLVIDYLWLGVIMSKFYKTELGSLARVQGDALAPVIWAAAVVYVLIPLGIVLFVLPRVSPDHLIASALMWGFIYGIVLYGVYDMTNYSLVSSWSLRMSLVDILWGGSINAVASCLAALLDRWYT